VAEWPALPIAEVLAALDSSAEAGLAEAEAVRRLALLGPNVIVERGGRSPRRIVWEQFTATMVLILLAAAVLSALLQKWTETTSILAIVLLFGGLGFLQEYRAERALAALKQLAVPSVRVRRGGALRDISARALVRGDVVVLEAGNVIPADLRVLEAVNLRVQEAMLTGESEAVEKETGPLAGADLPLGDRRNMAYMGTVAVYGRGAGVVTQTGMGTELGRIAGLIQSVPQETTLLQQRLDRVGKTLAVAGIIVAALVMVIGVARGEPVGDMFLTAISVAVAVVPEGLPAVVTFTLALGAQKMLKRHALIRKLPAVETLGSVTVICSDKTGTLTENRMTVTVIDVAGHRLELTEALRQRGLVLNATDRQPPPPEAMRLLLAGGAVCNDATLQPGAAPGKFHTLGDPTEGALLVAALHAGLTIEAARLALPRVSELPFDADRKRMTTVHRFADTAWLAQLSVEHWRAGDYVAFTKGAVDGLLDVATRVWNANHSEPLTADWRQRIERANADLAQNGMRVLGVAMRPLAASAPDGALERDLILLGLVGMMDPPRPEVKTAVQTALRAGIRPIMITGDHPLTALAIAADLGLGEAGQALTGADLNRLSPAELEAAVDTVSVFARVSPEHKLQIVAALQRRGHIVAMTGDGVNDAPALKKANIGVAMGITGTDVAKEAADLVLLDDNFATIVASVEEGRVIYDNLRRFVKFSIAGNAGKVAVMLAAPLVGINAALLPLQLLWLNLLTDGLLGLGLGVEPAESNVMRRPPHSPQAGIFSGGLGRHVIWVGLMVGALALGAGGWYYAHNLTQWQTVIFTALAFEQIGQALAARSNRESLFRIGLLSNPLLTALVVAVFLLQLGAITLPFTEHFFKIVRLTGADWLVCLACGAVIFAAIEIEKWLARRQG
jgi:Ca2+-transporting ATPase